MKATEAFDKEEERRSQQPAGPRKRIPFFRLDIGKSTKIRFLWELGEGRGLYRHSRQEKPKTVSCFRNVEYGEKDCPYCAEEAGRKGAAPSKMEYFWLVYNYNRTNEDGTVGGVELLNFRDTTYTPIKHLRAIEEDSGSITDRDFTIKRVPALPPKGSSMQASQYLAMPSIPSMFAVDLSSVEVPTQEEVVEFLRPWEIRNGPPSA